jgi:hypothetical protein
MKDNKPARTNYLIRLRAYVTNKGLDAWNAFTTDVLQNGTPDAWKYVQDFATDIVSLSE